MKLGSENEYRTNISLLVQVDILMFKDKTNGARFKYQLDFFKLYDLPLKIVLCISLLLSIRPSVRQPALPPARSSVHPLTHRHIHPSKAKAKNTASNQSNSYLLLNENFLPIHVHVLSDK